MLIDRNDMLNKNIFMHESSPGRSSNDGDDSARARRVRYMSEVSQCRDQTVFKVTAATLKAKTTRVGNALLINTSSCRYRRTSYGCYMVTHFVA